jgi:hypothetical protein
MATFREFLLVRVRGDRKTQRIERLCHPHDGVLAERNPVAVDGARSLSSTRYSPPAAVPPLAAAATKHHGQNGIPDADCYRR